MPGDYGLDLTPEHRAAISELLSIAALIPESQEIVEHRISELLFHRPTWSMSDGSIGLALLELQERRRIAT
jgi:hypothetical protein